jgi:hypothetical protein
MTQTPKKRSLEEQTESDNTHIDSVNNNLNSTAPFKEIVFTLDQVGSCDFPLSSFSPALSHSFLFYVFIADISDHNT